MDAANSNSHQANGFSSSADASFRYILRQPPNLAQENAWVLPAAADNQREDIPPPDRGVAEPARMQDMYHVDVAYQGIVDYHPQPLANPTYVFPDVERVRGIPAQVQPNAPANQEHNPFGYIAPGLVQPFVHRVPTPDPPPQAGAENLRRLAGHYLHHPDAQVRMVTMEPAAAGRIKVAVIFETPDF